MTVNVPANSNPNSAVIHEYSNGSFYFSGFEIKIVNYGGSLHSNPAQEMSDYYEAAVKGVLQHIAETYNQSEILREDAAVVTFTQSLTSDIDASGISQAAVEESE